MRNHGLHAVLALTLLAVPVRLVAQQPRESQVGVAVAGGLTALPDALTTQCGSEVNGGGGGGPEGGVALLVRMRRWIVLHADTRATYDLPVFACGLVGTPRYTAFPAGARHDEWFATSTLRAGLETPPGLPLLRLTAGLGIVWGRDPLPLGVMALAWSTRGAGKRFLIEVERAQARVRAEDVRYDYGSQQSITRPILVYPAVYAVRMGFEVPLGARPDGR